MRSSIRHTAAALAVVATAAPLALRAQGPRGISFSQSTRQLVPAPINASRRADTFVAEDALGVISFTIGDLTDDGRFIAATSSVRRDAYGVDFRRDGDPTYVRGALTRVMTIDTKVARNHQFFQR